MPDYEEFSREDLLEALRELEEQLHDLENERDEWEEKAKKVKADFENYRKDEEERRENWKKEAERKLAEDLIEVLDNLERAIASAEEEETGVVKGVKMVADQLYGELEKRGLEKIDAEGEEFDPELHKAVETRGQESGEATILEQKRKGYMFDEEVLREAEVVVGKEES